MATAMQIFFLLVPNVFLLSMLQLPDSDIRNNMSAWVATVVFAAKVIPLIEHHRVKALKAMALAELVSERSCGRYLKIPPAILKKTRPRFPIFWTEEGRINLLFRQCDIYEATIHERRAL